MRPYGQIYGLTPDRTTYGYDNDGQLASSLGFTSGGVPVTAEQLGFGYDAGWNMTSRSVNGSPSYYGVNNLNQVTSDPSFTYVYDANGNRTQQKRGTDIVNQYTYDEENRLVSIWYRDPWYPSAQYQTDFQYDGLGRLRRRIEHTYPSGGGFLYHATNYYIYDGMRVVQERDGNNTPTVGYTRGNDLSGTLEGAGGIGGLLERSSGYSSSTGNWNTHNCYHADGMGNITYMINASQAMVANYKYDPYGRTISSSGSLASANLYRFSSKEVHVSSGMYYYGYRFYDPNSQRWLNRDPLGESGFEVLRYRNNTPLRIIKNLDLIASYNLYGFVRNQPTRFHDAFGLVLGDAKCARAIEQVEAARELYESEPSSENAVAWLKAVDQMMIDCEPPPPPPPEPPGEPAPVPTGPVCEVAKKTCFWATVGVVTYWVCSEASRVLFPPRNLVPIP